MRGALKLSRFQDGAHFASLGGPHLAELGPTMVVPAPVPAREALLGDEAELQVLRLRPVLEVEAHRPELSEQPPDGLVLRGRAALRLAAPLNGLARWRGA